jgi:UDP-2,4-diacetamido-2,4,6-trideoxy-beta-L-altropyranose hydrolase
LSRISPKTQFTHQAPAVACGVRPKHMRDRILLLTECGSEIGFGHLTRCLSLAHAFREAGREIGLWVLGDELTQEQLPPWSKAIDWTCLANEAVRELRQAYALMVDSPGVSSQLLERIGQINPRLAIVDDWPRRSYDRGIVIDWTIGAEKFAYPLKSANVRYLLGSQYCAIRPEFSSVLQRSFTEAPREVLISFGGSDIRQLTVPVLSVLNEEFPTLQKRVIVGAGVRDKSFIDKACVTNTTFHVACDAVQMCTLMRQADFAICAGGQTLYELASQGLPPVVICVTDNQQDDIQEFAAARFAWFIGRWDSPELVAKMIMGVRTIWPAAERRIRSTIGRQCIDGHGAQRLVAACLEHWNNPVAVR